MRAYLEKWIAEVLGEDNFPGPLLIERAHRVGKINSREVYQQNRPPSLSETCVME